MTHVLLFSIVITETDDDPFFVSTLDPGDENPMNLDVYPQIYLDPILNSIYPGYI